MRNAALLAIAVSLALATAAPAQARDPEDAREEVRLTLSAEGWAKTETARVEVLAQLTLLQENRSAVRAEVTGALAELAPDADWRLVGFDRGSDPSGAERWTIRAEARLPQGALDGLASRARSLGSPGKQYRVASIQAVPSLAEREAALAALRARIYAMAREEVKAAAPLWPGRTVVIRSVDFSPLVRPLSAARARAEDVHSAMAAAPSSASGPLAIEQKLTLTAAVTLAPEPISGTAR